MTIELKELVNSVYLPPYKKHDATVGSLYAPSQVELFSLARFALLKALRGLNWQPGEKVLVPEYICRDLLAPLNIMKADIIFYEVSENMEPVQAPRDWPVARAVIAVNYFGLPQNLAPFFEYKKRTGAILIEDNAHGFLSRDEQGILLGMRGDFGLLSIRKSLPIPNGGALLINHGQRFRNLREKAEWSALGLRYKIKNNVRHIVPYVGARNIQRATAAIRQWRKLRHGYEIDVGGTQDEFEIPGNETPVAIDSFINRYDLSRIIDYRLRLYDYLSMYLKSTGVQPVVEILKLGTVPYVYPFYCEKSGIDLVREKLKRIGLECFPWPSLPQAVLPRAKKHYTNLYCVRFQW